MRRPTILGAAAAALLASAVPALSHARLVHAEPGVGATVGASPSQIKLAFTEGVVAAFSGVVVTDAAGRMVKTGAPTAAGMELTVPLSTRLAAGEYDVRWHAVSVDTHKTQGSFRFTVAP